jgi:hypothetical protein
MRLSTYAGPFMLTDIFPASHTFRSLTALFLIFVYYVLPLFFDTNFVHLYCLFVLTILFPIFSRFCDSLIASNSLTRLVFCLMLFVPLFNSFSVLLSAFFYVPVSVLSLCFTLILVLGDICLLFLLTCLFHKAVFFFCLEVLYLISYISQLFV